MINHTWMDDIEIRINVFVASAQHDCLQLQLEVERQKMNVKHSYILCQHFNCKCYLVNMTTTIVPCFRDICMHGFGLKNKYLLRLSKPTKPQ